MAPADEQPGRIDIGDREHFAPIDHVDRLSPGPDRGPVAHHDHPLADGDFLAAQRGGRGGYRPREEP